MYFPLVLAGIGAVLMYGTSMFQVGLKSPETWRMSRRVQQVQGALMASGLAALLIGLILIWPS